MAWTGLGLYAVGVVVRDVLNNATWKGWADFRRAVTEKLLGVLEGDDAE